MKNSVLAVAAVLLTTTLTQGRTIALKGDDLVPESIAYRAETHTYYVSSAGNGSVTTIQENGQSTQIQAPGADGRKVALGIKLDEKRDRLFVAGVDAVYVYSL